MSTVLHRTINSPTPQNRSAAPGQVKNSAGGYVYRLAPADALERFLILGTEGGTYYASEKDLTKQGMALVASCVQTLSASDYFAIVERAAKVAPKRTYALWAISEALVSGDDEYKARVPHAVKECVFTGTDLFELASYVRGRRGWGPTVRKAFDAILAELDEDKLALWAVKYRDRHGFTWRDMLRLQHTKADTPRRDAVFSFMTGKSESTGSLVIDGYQKVQTATDENEIISIVESYGLPWEALTDEQRTDAVWKACLPNIGNQAVLRNLASFTRRGMNEDIVFSKRVVERLQNAFNLHPIKILDALRTYQSGGAVGVSRGGTYTPHMRWAEALDDALEASFTGGVNVTGKRVLVGLDVSGSMGSLASGSRVLTCRDVGAALSLAFVRNEEQVGVFGFTSTGGRYSRDTGFTPLPFNRRTSFDDAVRTVTGIPFGGTDCAIPMEYARSAKIKVDTFIVITDNETWAGRIHPMEALRAYRRESGIDAQLIVIGLTATRFSIADPADRGTLDIAGFSSDLPTIVEKFMTMT